MNITGEAIAHARPIAAKVQVPLEQGVKDPFDKGAFTRSGNPSDHVQGAEKEQGIHRFEVVFLGLKHLNLSKPWTAAGRHFNGALSAEILGGQGAFGDGQLFLGARKHHLATF